MESGDAPRGPSNDVKKNIGDVDSDKHNSASENFNCTMGSEGFNKDTLADYRSISVKTSIEDGEIKNTKTNIENDSHTLKECAPISSSVSSITDTSANASSSDYKEEEIEAITEPFRHMKLEDVNVTTLTSKELGEGDNTDNFGDILQSSSEDQYNSLGSALADDEADSKSISSVESGCDDDDPEENECSSRTSQEESSNSSNDDKEPDSKKIETCVTDPKDKVNQVKCNSSEIQDRVMSFFRRLGNDSRIESFQTNSSCKNDCSRQPEEKVSGKDLSDASSSDTIKTDTEDFSSNKTTQKLDISHSVNFSFHIGRTTQSQSSEACKIPVCISCSLPNVLDSTSAINSPWWCLGLQSSDKSPLQTPSVSIMSLPTTFKATTSTGILTLATTPDSTTPESHLSGEHANECRSGNGVKNDSEKTEMSSLFNKAGHTENNNASYLSPKLEKVCVNLTKQFDNNENKIIMPSKISNWWLMKPSLTTPSTASSSQGNLHSYIKENSDYYKTIFGKSTFSKPGKLSCQPSTTPSINFPISCSRTNESGFKFDINSHQWNRWNSFPTNQSEEVFHHIEIEDTNSYKSTPEFKFLPSAGNGQKVENNKTEGDWNTLLQQFDSKGSVGCTASETLLSSMKCTNKENPFNNASKQPFTFPQMLEMSNRNKIFKFTPSIRPSNDDQSPFPVSDQVLCSQSNSTETGVVGFEFKPLSFNSLKCSSPGISTESPTKKVPSSNFFSGVTSSSEINQAVFHGAERLIKPSVTVHSYATPGLRKQLRRINKITKLPATNLPVKEKFQFPSTGIVGVPFVPFKCVIGKDVLSYGASSSVTIRYHHISCMDEYKSFSPEELRFNFYTTKKNPSGFFTFNAASDRQTSPNKKNFKNVEVQTDESKKLPAKDTALQEIWRALECPVCLDVVLPPVYQCEMGHHACSTCWNKMVSCPLCKRRKSGTRNYMAESLLEQVSLPCRYHIEGCKESVQRSTKLSHEQTCIYRMYQCPYHLCNQAYSYQNMVKHFKKSHKSILHNDLFCTAKQEKFSYVLYKDQVCPSLVHSFDIPKWGLFFLRQATVRFSTALYVQVMYALPDSKEHFYYLEVCDHDDCRKESYKGRVSPIGKSSREIIDSEEYLAVSDLLHKSAKKATPLKIIVNLW